MRRLVLMLVLVVIAGCSSRGPVRTLEAVVPANGASTLDLTANIGAVDITPSPDANVHVSIAFQPPTSFFGLFISNASLRAIQAASLSHSLEQGTLKLTAQYPANADANGVNEHWSVAMPASLHFNSHLSIGKINASGIAGGVEADLNVGKVQLDVPGGPLKITANVGKIQATVHSVDYGDVNLGANVGEVALSVNGSPAGEHQKVGAGDSLSYKGGGKNTISLQVNTGKVALDLTGTAAPP